MKDGHKPVVIISGASSGIGKECAIYLSQKGFRVYAGVRNPQALEKSLNLTPVILDITSDENIQELLHLITKQTTLDDEICLVNNAGYAVLGPIESLSRQEWFDQMNVNLIGHMCMIKTFLPLMRARGGRIINMGSTSGIVAWPYAGAYAASKFAFEGVSDALRVELKQFAIPVSILEPGAIQTSIWKKVASSLTNRFDFSIGPCYRGPVQSTLNLILSGVKKNNLTAHHVALVVEKALTARHPKSRYLIGRSAYLQKFLHFVFPAILYDWIKFYLPYWHFKKNRD